ncbi:hypothetical protein [Streptomyces violascens]|uniref:hypothetical protein n=1 Tax=Streptomyces violascens TaxID=67381 RepID=UPI0036915987
MEVLIAAIITGGIAILALMHYSLEARRVHVRETEQFYLKRYWELLDRLPPEALADDFTGPKILSDGMKVTSLLYLRVSEDLCEMRRQGNISDRTWRLRCTAMNNQIRRWPMIRLWAEVRDGKQFPLLGKLTANPDKYQPCELNILHRYWLGLTRPLFGPKIPE